MEQNHILIGLISTDKTFQKNGEKNMGIQPTNAGINFQQRVSAWYLIILLFEIELSQFFEIDNCDDLKIEQIAFECDKPIDDLIISTESNVTFFLQMKRSVSLSLLKDSDLYSAFDQFIRQFAQGTKKEEYYVLVTGPDSSSRITKVLKKVLYAIRLNPAYFIENPLNKTEKEVYDKYKQLVQELYLKHIQKDLTSEVFILFSKRVIIQAMDLEEDGYNENAAIMYLLPHSKTPPRLIWSHLIRNALSFASQRLTINREGIQGILKPYLKLDLFGKVLKGIDEEKSINSIHLMDSDTSMARDVVIVNWKDEEYENALCVMELIRFNEDGSRRYLINEEGYLILNNGLEFKVIHRCSTNSGALRYLEENDVVFKDFAIILAPANVDIEEEENSNFLVIHKQWYLDALNASFKKGMYCLHCGKPISESSQYTIEIDDSEPEVGFSHRECIRPIDRVTGLIESDLFEDFHFLKKFDFQKWIDSIEGSQTGLVQMIRINHKVPVAALWDPYADYIYEFDYCIKTLQDDGSISYIHDRNLVQRFNKSNAKKTAKDFNEYLKKQQKKRDPMAVTSIHNVFGSYSQLLQMKEPEEKILEMLSVEVTRFTEQIGKIHNKSRNFYAPLIIIKINDQDEELLTYYGRVVMISNPLELGVFLDNWKKAGLIVMNYELIILANDMEFDNKVRQIFKSGRKVVIDPLMDQKGKVIKGVLLESQYAFANNHKR
jgi:hypothetical protein